MTAKKQSSKTKKWLRIIAFSVLALAAISLAVVYFGGVNIDVLNPQGHIAARERDLIVFTLLLSLVVVLPVFFMLFFFAWKYRADNHKARYTPDWDGNKWLEVVWWGIPCVIILILGVITWKSSHELDPYRAIDSTVKPVTVQVVALQWKWLFIYPDQKIATINDLRFPEKTPINFVITGDAPMNSFWIPSLGGQVYAMSGMSTKLHLIADTIGEYKGSSANISGEGFADMAFTAKSVSRQDFDAWTKDTATTGGSLDGDRYVQLAQPGVPHEAQYFKLGDASLYDTIIMKYMMPSSHDDHGKTATMEGM